MAKAKASSKAAKTPAKKTVDRKVASQPVAAKSPKIDKNSIRIGALIAEFVGTFILAAAILNLVAGGDNLAIMFTLIILVVVLGVISGAHLNPAITIAALASRKIGGAKSIGYITAQILGGMMAMLVVGGLLSANYSYNNNIVSGLEKVGIEQSMIDEAGGLEEWAKSQNFEDVDDLVGVLNSQYNLGIKDEAPKPFEIEKLVDGKEWVSLLSEILGSIIFGLGVGYVFFTRRGAGSHLRSAFAIGGGLFLGLIIGGTSVAVVLNPAVAAALGAFQWGDFATVAWPVLIYGLGTTAGITAGVLGYRTLARDSIAKSDLA